MNKFVNDNKNKLKDLIVILLISFFFYSTILLIFINQGVSPLLVIRDLAQTCDEKLGVGFISNLGIILWIGISFILLFILRTALIKKSRYKKLLISGCTLSSILALDDFYLIHDKYITQEIIFFIYFLFAIYLVRKCLKEIILIDSYLFFSSYILFGFSILIDIVLQDIFPSLIFMSQILEEGFKFLGIFCWFFFWWKAGRIVLKENLKN